MWVPWWLLTISFRLSQIILYHFQIFSPYNSSGIHLWICEMAHFLYVEYIWASFFLKTHYPLLPSVSSTNCLSTTGLSLSSCDSLVSSRHFAMRPSLKFMGIFNVCTLHHLNHMLSGSSKNVWLICGPWLLHAKATFFFSLVYNIFLILLLSLFLQNGIFLQICTYTDIIYWFAIIWVNL